MNKNTTFSADERLIDAARRRASAQHTTLNEEFRRGLRIYADGPAQAEQALRTIERVSKHLKFEGRKFTRDELNER